MKSHLDEIERLFDEKFHCGQVGCNCVDGIGSIVNIKSFLRTSLISLLEKYGEELIKAGEKVVDDGAYGDEYCEREDCHFQNGYEVARDCTDAERTKLKEIITSLK